MLHYIQAQKDPRAVAALQKKMAEYYAHSECYYENINFTVSNWEKKEQIGYQRILELCEGKKIAEVGCGEAAILKAIKDRSTVYAGCDFSEKLISNNRHKYPDVNFEVVNDPSKIPLESGLFDVVFCVFVLEHVVQPDLFLKELVRCCKNGGKVVILCPDYAGRSGISSQIVGFSSGNGVEKIKSGRLIDGLVTGLVNKLLMPLYFKFKLRDASQNPLFLLNNEPACFCREFYPDADAVYVTHRGEIIKTLCDLGCKEVVNSKEMEEYTSKTRTLFIESVKV